MKSVLTQWFRPLAVVSFMVWLYVWRVTNSYRKLKQLQGKVVVLTGASSGLGEALAHQLFSLGCRLVLMGRNIDRLQLVKQQLLQSHQPEIVYPPVLLPLDLSEPDQVPRALSDAVSVYGHVDILINNAGISYRGRVLTTEAAVDALLMQVNYLSQVIATRQVLPSMLARRSGRIVLISSLQGRIALPFRSSYAASKHALHAFGDSLRAELAGSGVCVTTVAPSYINTPLSTNALTGSGARYGRTDTSTSRGMTAASAAAAVVDTLAPCCRCDELLLAPCLQRAAVALRALWPQLYFAAVRWRARRGTGLDQSNEEPQMGAN